MKIIKIGIFASFVACQYLEPKEEKKEIIIARVGEEVLTKEDVNALLPGNTKLNDSSALVERFALDWIKKQLMIKRAEDEINFNEARIKNRVLDYQYALIVHEYEQSYIRKNIVKEVPEWEIKEYYREKSENFILRENLAKCIFVRFPKDVPNLRRFKKYFNNYPSEDSVAFWEYANKFSDKTFAEHQTWVKFEEILMETPLFDLNDKTTFLKKNSSIEVADDSFTYFIKILDKRTIGEVAPMQYISERIEDIIINKRKIALKKELEKRVYDEAVEQNAFEIYRY